MFQDDYPEDKDNDFLKPQTPPVTRSRTAPGTFRMIAVTPHSLKLVETVINRSADFDRAMKEDCESALHAYGDLVEAKGKLVKYIGRLMDMADDKGLNSQRTSQVRFE